MQDNNDSPERSLSDTRKAHAKETAKRLLAETTADTDKERVAQAREKAGHHLHKLNRQRQNAQLVFAILDDLAAESEFVEETAQELADDLPTETETRGQSKGDA